MRNFPEQTERVETGAVQFGKDWPGLFIRGDDAFAHSLNILTVWQHVKKMYEKQNMPLDLYLALMELAGMYDVVQDGVVVGGRIARENITGELLQQYESKLPADLSEAVKDTIQQPSSTEQTHE